MKTLTNRNKKMEAAKIGLAALILFLSVGVSGFASGEDQLREKVSFQNSNNQAIEMKLVFPSGKRLVTTFNPGINLGVENIVLAR